MRVPHVALLAILCCWLLVIVALRAWLPLETVHSTGGTVRAWIPYVEQDPSGIRSYCVSTAGGQTLPPFLSAP